MSSVKKKTKVESVIIALRRYAYLEKYVHIMCLIVRWYDMCAAESIMFRFVYKLLSHDCCFNILGS